MNLEDVTLSKISQSQKDKYCVVTSLRYLERPNPETESRTWLSVAGRRGEWRVGVEWTQRLHFINMKRGSGSWFHNNMNECNITKLRT
jgi:hypothetical protein